MMDDATGGYRCEAYARKAGGGEGDGRTDNDDEDFLGGMLLIPLQSCY